MGWRLSWHKAVHVHDSLYRGPVSLSTDSQGTCKSLKWFRVINAPMVTVYYSQYEIYSCIVCECEVCHPWCLRSTERWIDVRSTLVCCWGKVVPTAWELSLSTQWSGPEPRQPEGTPATLKLKKLCWLMDHAIRFASTIAVGLSWRSLRTPEDRGHHSLRTELRSVGNLRWKHSWIFLRAILVPFLPPTHPISILHCRGNFKTLNSVMMFSPVKPSMDFPLPLHTDGNFPWIHVIPPRLTAMLK